jgi:uncharacterized protein
MMQVRCPICAKSLKIKTSDDLPSFPFCSERCRLIDLGRWVDEKYSVPVTKPGEINGQSGGTVGDEDEAES